MMGGWGRAGATRPGEVQADDAGRMMGKARPGGGPKPVPEGPQVRTMTFVCDLFSPHEGSISLAHLADNCRLCEDGHGIVGLSCQLSTPDATRIVKRGQVKEARRHFAHQAQLRLSLPSSPNLSVKVFSTGRLQIAGCHDEASCIEAVKIVAEALNEIQADFPEIVKRQVKSVNGGAGQRLEGKMDMSELPSPRIVMINCSFDSGMGALGYGLDPHRLTDLLLTIQRTTNCVEDVAYNPEQRYTGVKVKFKPTPAAGLSRGAGGTDREVFIGMFPSGKTVITGAVKWEEVNQSYEFARSVLCDNFEMLRVPLTESPGPPRKKARKV
ncbi:hypothetical protein T484DRAFT_1934126 [Baffinella frigidus]|nr:hypothetical protein T484DRAFT_1934126 [Cryptophyta sp. CCMP2293]